VGNQGYSLPSTEYWVAADSPHEDMRSSRVRRRTARGGR